MLLSSDYSIEKRIVFDFVFDNGESKQVKLSLGDIAEITYNAGRTRKKITGKISRIEAGNETVTHPVKVCHEPIPVNCDHYHWWIMVDGSEYNQSKMERIDLKTVLDINLIAGESSISTVTSPIGDYRVTDFRVIGGILQLSMDHQQTWLNVTKLPDSDVNVSERDKPLADKVSELIPKCVNPGEKADLILAIVDLVKQTIREHHRNHKQSKEDFKNGFIDDLMDKLKDSGALDAVQDHVTADDVSSHEDIVDMMRTVLGDDYEEEEEKQPQLDDQTVNAILKLLASVKV